MLFVRKVKLTAVKSRRSKGDSLSTTLTVFDSGMHNRIW